VVLTHGYCLTEAVWHYQKGVLAGGSFGMATWDLPGHGHSPGLAPGGLTLDLCADSLARVVDEHANGGVVLVGHSLGGVVSVAYLHRHAEAARRLVRGVALISTPLMHFVRSAVGAWPGARDRMANPQETLDLAEQLPRGRTLRFPDSGHAIFLEEHERLNGEVRRFARRRLQSSSGAGST
jgi:pimeloyl-ACP methyl ester carboxylesterase